MIMVTLAPAVQVMLIISKPLTVTLVAPVAVVEDTDLRRGIRGEGKSVIALKAVAG